MGHRAKHRRENWIPERLAAAEDRARAEEARKLQAELDSGDTELEPGS